MDNAIRLGDRIRIKKDPGWQDVTGVVTQIDCPPFVAGSGSTIRFVVDKGARYSHTGKLISEERPEYCETPISWSASEVEVIPQVECPECGRPFILRDDYLCEECRGR